MDDGLTLFLSLPVTAQNSVRRRLDSRDPDNLRVLTRAAYAWVQTLVEAQCIAEFLIAESDSCASSLIPEHSKSARAESLMRSVPTVHA